MLSIQKSAGYRHYDSRRRASQANAARLLQRSALVGVMLQAETIVEAALRAAADRYKRYTSALSPNESRSV